MLVVAGVWWAARVVYFNGYYAEDAPGYVSDAIAMASGHYAARNHVNGLNVATYGPVALFFWVFGKSEAVLSLWPLFCSLLGVVSIGGLSAILFGRPLAILAAFLYATYPGDVFFSTVVMPDAVQSGWLGFSMFLVVYACVATPNGSPMWLVAAGAAMGVCHLVRANGALLLPVGACAVAVLSFVEGTQGTAATRERGVAPLVIRRCVTYVGGWVSILALEGVAYWWAVGDMLFRFHVVDHHYGQMGSIEQWGLNTHPLTIPYSALAPLTWMRFGSWGELNQDQAYHALLFSWALLALAGGSVSLILARKRVPARAIAGYAVAAAWFAWPLLYHQFGSQSLTQFIPIHRLSRHLVVYAPGAIVVTVAGCLLMWNVAQAKALRTALAAIALVALPLHLHFGIRGETIAYEAYHRIKDTYTRIRDHLPSDTRVIVADPGDLGFFDFWLNPLGEERVRLVAFANYRDCAQLSEGVVLTFSNPGWHGLSAPAIQETVARLPCLVNPPPTWRLLYDGFPERVYSAAPRDVTSSNLRMCTRPATSPTAIKG